MAVLAILVIVGLGYLCLYLGWKQGTRLGEKRALEQIAYRAVLAEKNAQEEVKRRESAEYKFNNQVIRADAWQKVAEEKDLKVEKKKLEKSQKEWEEWLHRQQLQQQQMANQTSGTYNLMQGLFPWFRG